MSVTSKDQQNKKRTAQTKFQISFDLLERLTIYIQSTLQSISLFVGSRSPSEFQNYPSTTNSHQLQQLRRELPQDLSKERILQEAEFVLAQAERVKCRAEGGSEIVGGKLNEKNRDKIQRKKRKLKKFN